MLVVGASVILLEIDMLLEEAVDDLAEIGNASVGVVRELTVVAPDELP